MINYYFCEGQTEKNLLSVLKSSKVILPGKVSQFNFWDKPAQRAVRTINRSKLGRIVIVFDTDVSVSVQRFVENMKFISNLAGKNKLVLMPHHLNLEDELVHACAASSTKQLCSSLYGSRVSRSQFKSKLANDNALYEKLVSKDFDINKYCSRKGVFEDALVNFDLRNIVVGNSGCIV